MLPGASDIILIRTRTASSRVLLLLLPAGGILLPYSCLRCAGFCTFLSAANTLWNAVSAFVVVTSACQIIGVILLSLFSVTLSHVGSATETSSERTVLRSSHFCVRQRNTLQVRFLEGHLVHCMCSFYVCTPYLFS